MSSDSGAQGPPPRKKRAYGVACTVSSAAWISPIAITHARTVMSGEENLLRRGPAPVWRMQGDGRGLSASVSTPRPVLVLMRSVSARPLRRLRSPSSTLPPGPDPAIAQLEARMRWMERRVKQLEDMMDVPPGWTNPPSPSGETAALDPPPFAATSDAPLAGSSRDAAKYRLTYDESGNVSDPRKHHADLDLRWSIMG